MTTTSAITVPSPQELESWGDRKLDNAIRKGHVVAGAHMKNYEDAATATGILLLERKRRLGHGKWLPWVAENFDGHEATAKRYMARGREWLANRSPMTDLDPPAEAPEPPASDLPKRGEPDAPRPAPESEEPRPPRLPEQIEESRRRHGSRAGGEPAQDRGGREASCARGRGGAPALGAELRVDDPPGHRAGQRRAEGREAAGEGRLDAGP